MRRTTLHGRCEGDRRPRRAASREPSRVRRAWIGSPGNPSCTTMCDVSVALDVKETFGRQSPTLAVIGSPAAPENPSIRGGQ